MSYEASRRPRCARNKGAAITEFVGQDRIFKTRKTFDTMAMNNIKQEFENNQQFG